MRRRDNLQNPMDRLDPTIRNLLLHARFEDAARACGLTVPQMRAKFADERFRQRYLQARQDMAGGKFDRERQAVRRAA